MPTTIRRLITLVLSDDDGNDLTPQQQIDAGFALDQAVQNRLFAQGFLPDDVQVDSWTIIPTE
jgi:hypothetical protein